MLLVDLVAGAMVTTGASLLLVGIIGLVLTQNEEKMGCGGAGAAATRDEEVSHECEDQSTGA